jgi:hypothetical protein
MKMTSSIKNFDNRAPLCAFLLVPFVLGCFALSPQARAVCQEGCLTNQNTVLGDDALLSNTTGFGNTANGLDALYFNTTGNNNTAGGVEALAFNTTGSSNTANGYFALTQNTTGSNNTANGRSALGTNTTGSENTANGYLAMFGNAAGNFNTATGSAALYGNFSTGSHNTANGAAALFSNMGSNNSATGSSALSGNTTGNNNTADGEGALANNTTGENNIALGFNAGKNVTTGSNNIYIGNPGSSSGESTNIRIGRIGAHHHTFIAGISGATVTGTAVVVDSNGQLGVEPSSQRFKQHVQTMGDASNILLALRPVTFEYKPDVDPDGIPQFGLVAEDVEKVNPDLVTRNEEGKPYTVRYEAVEALTAHSGRP